MKRIVSLMLLLVLSLTSCTIGVIGSKKGSGKPETKSFQELVS